MSILFRDRLLKIELLLTSSLILNPRNARRHSRRQIKKIARTIERLGWAAPLIVDEAYVVLCGNGRLEAALELGMQEVPCIRITDLSEHEKIALALADNKLGDESSFDEAVVNSLLTDLSNVSFDMEATGFETGEIDFRVDGPAGPAAADPADAVLPLGDDYQAVTRLGDLWCLDQHRLICGSALEEEAYKVLMGEERAQMVFVDSPYNVKIGNNVSGLGRNKHREFLQGSGEMSTDQFRDSFLRPAHELFAKYSVDGSLHFSCMDWRGISTLIVACEPIYDELKNLLVWVKRSGAMGSLWRSQHELIAVFKKGAAPHTNNIELGKHGRYRTNVLDYPGANSFSATRDGDLAAHPTVKPTALCADLIRDVTNRGDLVLDAFAGSGTTILAAERTKRRAAAIELDPLYCDVAVRRWQALTKKQATLDGDGRSFDEIAAARCSAKSSPSGEEDAA